MMVLIYFGFSKIVWVVFFIFAIATSFAVNSIISHSTESTYDIIYWMLWTWMAVWAEISLFALFALSSNEAIRSVSNILLVVLAEFCIIKRNVFVNKLWSSTVFTI